MSSIIDKITFEVSSDSDNEQVKYITLLFKGNIVADVICYISFSRISDQPFVSLHSLNLGIAEYLSFSKDDIKKIIGQFILNGGLGIDEIAYVI